MNRKLLSARSLRGAAASGGSRPREPLKLQTLVEHFLTVLSDAARHQIRHHISPLVWKFEQTVVAGPDYCCVVVVVGGEWFLVALVVVVVGSSNRKSITMRVVSGTVALRLWPCALPVIN